MSSLVNDLKRLLGSATRYSAVVVESTAAHITVSSRNGTKTLPRGHGDATQYQPGDRVVVDGGNVVARVQRVRAGYLI